MLLMPNTSAAQSPAPSNLNLSCLDRQQREEIADCFGELEVCNAEFKEATTPPSAKVPQLIMAILAGFAAGVAIDYSARR